MKKLVTMFLVLAICLSLVACGSGGASNSGTSIGAASDNSNSQSATTASTQTDYPKMDEIEYYFVNGVSYGEPAALMGFTNNSKYTITSMLIYFTVKADATQEELSAFDTFVNEGDLEAEKIPTLNPYIYNHMVCDPGEKVEGATCTLFGGQTATDARQCELLVVESAEISFQGNDGKIYKVAYVAANNGYSLQSGTKPAKAWTEKDFAKAIPMPDTRFITVNYDEDDYYQFTAYDITFDQYQEYCSECQTAGFTNDIEDNTYSFWCTNDSGLTLNIRYFPYMNALSIETHYDAPQSQSDQVQAQVTSTQEETESPAIQTEDNRQETTETPVSESTNLQEDTIRPEFKEAMDAYEAFYDKYCKFMEEYKENPTDLSLLGKYTEMLTKLDEMNKAFESWDEDEMTTAELKYYLDVNNRVMQRMIDVAG